jgi:hypothetical protein
MGKGKEDKIESIRLRLDKDLLERIDLVAGDRGRNRYILEAIEARLEGRLPPELLEVMRDLESLRDRVEHLEIAQSTSIYRSGLSDEVKNEICLDEVDRGILAHLLKHEGASTPELAEVILGDVSKRRTAHDRVSKINARAIEKFGKPILEHKRGIVKGKRSAWWLIEPDIVLAS